MDRQKAVGVVLLGLIGLYFALQGREEASPPSRPASSPREERVGEEGGECLARVRVAALGYQEVRFGGRGSGMDPSPLLAWGRPSSGNPQGVLGRGVQGTHSPRGEARGGAARRLPSPPPRGVAPLAPSFFPRGIALVYFGQSTRPLCPAKADNKLSGGL